MFIILKNEINRIQGLYKIKAQADAELLFCVI